MTNNNYFIAPHSGYYDYIDIRWSEFLNNPDSFLITEMADGKEKYESRILNEREHFFFTLCNIICLEYISPENIFHWLSELRSIIWSFARHSVVGGISRAELIRKNIIDYYFKPITYDLLNVSYAREALKDEITKGMKIPSKQKTAKMIQNITDDEIIGNFKWNSERIKFFIESSLTIVDNFKNLDADHKEFDKERCYAELAPIINKFMENNYYYLHGYYKS